MKYYFAPMEGITGYIFRNAHQACFGGIEKYFSPFITPKPGSGLSTREKNDILPEHNNSLHLIPQILGNQAEGFLVVAKLLEDMGYQEVNFNLGCPSGTVVPKKKGAGFLAETDMLDRFLEEIFTKSPIAVSIKTRIGMYDPAEFEELLEIYNKYPVKELTVHARTREEYYQGSVHNESFAYAFAHSKAPVCCNGDLFSAKKIAVFSGQFPQADCVMIGRGLLIDPALATGEALRRDKLKAFHDRLIADYLTVLAPKDTLFKMKELSSWFMRLFPDEEKAKKKIRKAQSLAEYKAAAEWLIANGRMETVEKFVY